MSLLNMKICLQNVWYVFHKISYKYFVAPKLHIDIDDNQGVKKGEGEMVEGRQEVKVVVILKIGFFNILSDFLFIRKKGVFCYGH